MPTGGWLACLYLPISSCLTGKQRRPRKFTHRGFCNSSIYLVHVPFIFGKKLQTQTILSDLKKTVISTFPIIIAPFYHSGDSNNGGCNPIKST